MMAESGRSLLERMRWQFLTCVVVPRIAELGHYGCRFSDFVHHWWRGRPSFVIATLGFDRQVIVKNRCASQSGTCCGRMCGRCDKVCGQTFAGLCQQVCLFLHVASKTGYIIGATSCDIPMKISWVDPFVSDG